MDSSDDEAPEAIQPTPARAAPESKVKQLAQEAKSLASSTAPGLALDNSLDSTAHELLLKQQAAQFIQQRQSEIESYHASLNEALQEVRRIRGAEEERLAERMTLVQEAYAARLHDLQEAFLSQVEELQRRTLGHLGELRAESEASVAHRVRALSGGLAGAQSPMGAKKPGPAAAGAAAAKRAPTSPRTPAPARQDLPAFLTPQATRGAGGKGPVLLTAQFGAPMTTGRAELGGDGNGLRYTAAQYSPAANHTFTALVTGNRGTAGLHRAEPKVLDFLGGGDDDDDDI